jgi:hypothetical protein
MSSFQRLVLTGGLLLASAPLAMAGDHGLCSVLCGHQRNVNPPSPTIWVPCCDPVNGAGAGSMPVPNGSTYSVPQVHTTRQPVPALNAQLRLPVGLAR